MAPNATSGLSQSPGGWPDPSSHAGAQVGLVAAYQPPGVLRAFLKPLPSRAGCLLAGIHNSSRELNNIWRRGGRNTHFNVDLVINFVCFPPPAGQCLSSKDKLLLFALTNCKTTPTENSADCWSMTDLLRGIFWHFKRETASEFSTAEAPLRYPTCTRFNVKPNSFVKGCDNT